MLQVRKTLSNQKKKIVLLKIDQNIILILEILEIFLKTHDSSIVKHHAVKM